MRLPKPLSTPQGSAGDSIASHSGLVGPSDDYWPTARWCVLLSCGKARSIEPLPLPFTLIGSHPLCGIRITDPRVPPVAYFACALEDSIEVWPLCPIAFAQWGVVSSQHAILVGKHRIRLMHETHPRWQQVSSDRSRDEATYSCFTDPRSAISLFRSPATATTSLDLELEWDGTRHPQPVSRRVLILGADHPSTVRLRGLGLSICDHALVAAGDSIWMIRLNLNASDQNVANLVTRIQVGDAPVEIQQLRIRVTPGTNPSAETRFETDDLMPQPGVSETFGSLNLIADPGTNAEAIVDASPAEISHPAIRQAATNPSPDALTAGVTERLIQLGHSKVNRQKMLVCTAVLITTMGLLAWIICQMLWPLISKLTS